MPTHNKDLEFQVSLSLFYKAVAEMREAQKAFFKSRDGSILKKSIGLEKEVDAWIVRLDREADELLRSTRI